MKVLHCSYSAPPDPPGGTEVYVEALCRALRHHGVDGIVVAPGASERTFEYENLRIRTFPLRQPRRLEQLYGEADPAAADMFGRLLDEEAPDLVHQHALSPGCSAQLARQAKRRGIPVVFTYHTPTVTCQRGTLLEWGSSSCDGRLDVARCTACSLHALGGSKPVSRALARVPTAAGALLGRSRLKGGPWTALQMTHLVALRHREIRGLLDLVDQVVVLAPWTERVLSANGVPREKMVMCPHGIEQGAVSPPGTKEPRSGLKVAHLGRIDPVKGTALLVEAFRAVPAPDMTLDIFGVVQGGEHRLLLDKLRRAAELDGRIRFLPSIPHDHVVSALALYDLVAVPSQWMETGPLVVLEAFAAGVPVIGSDLGGIADKVTDGRDGLLVRPCHSVSSWRDALDRCHRSPEMVRRLALGVRPPRSMANVAEQMHSLYDRLIAQVTV